MIKKNMILLHIGLLSTFHALPSFSMDKLTIEISPPLGIESNIYSFLESPIGRMNCDMEEMMDKVMFKSTSTGSNYEKIKNRTQNKVLNQLNKTPSDISRNELSDLGNLLAAIQQNSTNYFSSMIESLEYEKSLTSPYEEGYAANIISPQDINARSRFVADACQVFSVREETSQTSEKLYATPGTLTDFMKVYIFSVKEAVGTLFARDFALKFVGQSLDDEQGLTLNDCENRKQVFSNHYLGCLERTLEIVSLLRPVAIRVSKVIKDSIFDLHKLDGYLSYAQEQAKIIAGEVSGLMVLQEKEKTIPADLPPKKLTDNQERKLRAKQKKIKEIEANLSKVSKEKVASTTRQEISTINTSSPQKIIKRTLPIDEPQYETFAGWAQKTENLKKEALASLKVMDERFKRKQDAKSLKKQPANLAKDSLKEKDEKIQEIDEVLPQKNIKNSRTCASQKSF